MRCWPLLLLVCPLMRVLFAPQFFLFAKQIMWKLRGPWAPAHFQILFSRILPNALPPLIVHGNTGYRNSDFGYGRSLFPRFRRTTTDCQNGEPCWAVSGIKFSVRRILFLFPGFAISYHRSSF